MFKISRLNIGQVESVLIEADRDKSELQVNFKTIIKKAETFVNTTFNLFSIVFFRINLTFNFFLS